MTTVKLNKIMNYVIDNSDFSTKEIEEVRRLFEEESICEAMDIIKDSHNNNLIENVRDLLDEPEEEEYNDSYHDEIWMIQDLDSDSVYYDFDPNEKVNALINLGHDCITYRASLEGWEDFSFDYQDDVDALGELEWEEMCQFSA